MRVWQLAHREVKFDLDNGNFDLSVFYDYGPRTAHGPPNVQQDPYRGVPTPTSRNDML